MGLILTDEQRARITDDELAVLAEIADRTERLGPGYRPEDGARIRLIFEAVINDTRTAEQRALDPRYEEFAAEEFNEEDD